MDTLIKKTFLIYREIQMESGAKSYMRKGFLMYEEMNKYFQVRRSLVIYDFAPDSSEENFIFFFISAGRVNRRLGTYLRPRGRPLWTWPGPAWSPPCTCTAPCQTPGSQPKERIVLNTFRDTVLIYTKKHTAVTDFQILHFYIVTFWQG